MRILIAEDEWLIAMVIEQTLMAAGIEVVGKAGAISNALKMIDEARFDAAVLDANLGGASAEPVALALRSKQIPFLVISGYSSHQGAGVLAEAPFLAKPFALGQLLAMVRELTA